MSAREEGTVLVTAEVSASGKAVGAKISQSSGYPDLDAAALRSIAEWSFAPATEDGKPMAQQVVVPVRLQLDHAATGAPAMLATPFAVAGMLLRFLGSVILLVGFVRSIILAKRKSNLWLWGMLPLWLFTYPVFVARHWSDARRNLAVVLLGAALLCLGVYLAPSSLWG
ncbi:MAG TPA: energy transducer TonB [Rhodanobacteraceae bacterium]|nr:energy transducer TonB [Rhodanobacteraceae bacterium]